ncbi:MAG: general secretion pathway protein GspF [Porticoccaceae bacterium]|jgi:general secretion pathway protein F|nr:general secretion pathway protein GspF [Porticoccaceae bacterium]MBT5577153.1 general secretion pathway protein GspF [Porticoccaceae bacterium]MBT7375271.1 general secretion pathway protein GspF [Porticoccaceae bacterium]
MPVFDYSAYDAAGKLVDGVVTADSERHARRLLKEKRLLPSKLSEVSQNPSNTNGRRRREARVNNFDLSLVLQQQAILIQSGLPLEDALRMTIEQAETDKQRRMVESWRSEIVEGRSFSEALRRSPYKIPEAVIAGIGVGEESGHLDRVLIRLAEDLENSAENRKTVTRALIYPATLIGTSIMVVAIMMVWVVPKITAIFNSSNRELPLITRIVIGLSEFTQAYGLYLLAVIVAGAMLFARMMKDPQRRERWHSMLLRVPGLGRWTIMANIADWSRSLGVLLNNGVPALAALKISSSVVNNLHLRRKMERVTESMRRGSSLQKALEENQVGSGFLIHMVGSGEASSELDKMLLRVADYYSLRLANAIEVFLKLINPVLIILMGMIILSVVAAVMLPIMDMNNMV